MKFLKISIEKYKNYKVYTIILCISEFLQVLSSSMVSYLFVIVNLDTNLKFELI